MPTSQPEPDRKADPDRKLQPVHLPPNDGGGRGAANLSKITAPTLNRVHPNARLFGRLDAAFERRVVWVHGPPGAGKTTLVASYLAARRIAPLWYRLDEGDADTATVFFYLAAAAAERSAPLPLPPPELSAVLATFTRRFFRDLFGGPQTVLVFDDYHAVAAESHLHVGLPHGLEEVPDGCHVVIISRAAPPASFARLRLNGIVEVVEPDALRMTEAEALGLARERGADVDARRVGAITHQTQGWAAGVILMLESGASAAALPQGARAVPEVLFDYFAGEILQRMEPHRRRLLPMLALLPAMTGAQADALTDSSDAAALLEDLRRRNYFTTRDLAADPRYRFHPLFRDFLGAILRAEAAPAALQALCLRAAALLDADGQPEAAVPLLTEAAAFDDLAALVRRRAKGVLEAGRHATLIEWFARLPKEAIERDGWLCSWYGEAHLYGPTAVPWARLNQAFARFKAAGDSDGQFLAWAALAETVRADAFGGIARYDVLIAELRAVLARHPHIESPQVMVRVAMGMAVALSRRSNARDEIALWQARARDAAAAIGDHNVSELAGNMFAITDMHDANYVAALRSLELQPDPMRDGHAPLSGQISGLIAHTMTLIYRLKPGDSATYVEAALRKCDEIGYHGWSHLLAGLVLHDACRRGDRAVSARWLARMKAYAAPFAADRGSHYHTLAAYHDLLHDDLRGAKAHAEVAVSVAVKQGWPFFETLARVALAETLIDEKNLVAAEAELDRLDALLARSATRVVTSGAICVRADLVLARGDPDTAAAILARALDLGRRQGDRRLGLSFARMQRLFAFAIERNIEPDYVRALVRDLGIRASDPLDERWPHPVRIVTCGGLGVSLDGAPLAFSRKTPKRLIQLLKAIVAHGGRNVPEEKLIDAVWADEDGDSARSALTVAIHRLRKLLGDTDAILVSGGTIGLDPARCWVDVWTLEHLLAEQVDEGGAGMRPPRCERIFALYRGDFLPDDRDAPWAAPLRTRLRRRFARMVCVRADMVDAPVADLFRRGLEAAPAAEDLYQGLMRHHLAQGRCEAGLAVYERLADRLRDGDGAAPSVTSEALYRKLQELGRRNR